nr:MAG TPA: hypothetical protein [Caudoviricetes sp.]
MNHRLRSTREFFIRRYDAQAVIRLLLKPYARIVTRHVVKLCATQIHRWRELQIHTLIFSKNQRTRRRCKRLKFNIAIAAAAVENRLNNRHCFTSCSRTVNFRSVGFLTIIRKYPVLILESSSESRKIGDAAP